MVKRDEPLRGEDVRDLLPGRRASVLFFCRAAWAPAVLQPEVFNRHVAVSGWKAVTTLIWQGCTSVLESVWSRAEMGCTGFKLMSRPRFGCLRPGAVRANCPEKALLV